MRLRLLQIFHNGSLVAGIFVLLLTPFVLLHGWLVVVMVGLVFLFFPWAAIMINNLAAGTEYTFLRVNGLGDIGTTSTTRMVQKTLGSVILVGMFLRWLEWPGWWVVLFDHGLLAGPALAFFLFGALSIYETAIRMVKVGAIKRCSNDHEFSPFLRSCPYCTATKNLELIHDPRHA